MPTGLDTDVFERQVRLSFRRLLRAARLSAEPDLIFVPPDSARAPGSVVLDTGLVAALASWTATSEGGVASLGRLIAVAEHLLAREAALLVVKAHGLPPTDDRVAGIAGRLDARCDRSPILGGEVMKALAPDRRSERSRIRAYVTGFARELTFRAAESLERTA
jgi:hypothetical protein